MAALAGVGDRAQLASRHRSKCSHLAAVQLVLRNEPLWPTRSSSRKNPVKRKTSAPPWVLVTETSSRPRVICSTCSNQRISCRHGSAGRRSCCGPKFFYGTRPAEGGNKAAKLRAIREALRTAKRVWLATDCDREGQLIGQEILEHYEYRGQVMRVLFTAQDSQTIRDAFGRAKPNSEYARLYAAAVARRQADQIYNLSLTRTATVILGSGRAESHRGWSREDADLGHRVQARVGNPELRATRLF